jgi:hypothetical protein
MSALPSILSNTSLLSAPDTYDWRNRKNMTPEVPKNFVISRDEQGEPLSLAQDMTWKLGPYDHRTRSYKNINFVSRNYSSDLLLIKQVQWLMFLIMYTRERGQLGSGISVGTLQAYHRLLGKMSVFCESKEVDLFYIFKTSHSFKEFTETITASEDIARAYTLAYHLSTLDTGLLGFETDLSNIAYNNIRDRKYDDNQTAIIPPRIYLSGLACLRGRIDEFVNHGAMIRPFLTELESYYTSNSHTGKNSTLSSQVVIDKAAHYGLSNLFSRHNVSCTVSLGRYLRSIQFASKCTIHAFSGMRDDEAYSLRYNCLTTKKIKNRNVLRLLGITTKLSKSRKSTYWITSPKINNALSAARLICDVIAQSYGVPSDTMLLFPNLSNLSFHMSKKRFSGDLDTPANLVHWHMNYIFDHADMVITAEDYDNLTKVDFQKKWIADERFQINKHWHFTTHQFRRSLAFYGIQSNLITYTSLKRQLQHLSRAMTLFYARGRNKYSNLFGYEINHFKNEYRSMNNIVSALNYSSEVLNSKVQLHGGHGAWIESNKKSESTVNIIMTDAETTKIAIHDGKIAYKSTVLGGCTNIDDCDRIMRAPLTSCLRCPGAVLTEIKMQKTIKSQRTFLNSLGIGTSEYLTELEDLLELETYYRNKFGEIKDA